MAGVSMLAGLCTQEDIGTGSLFLVCIHTSGNSLAGTREARIFQIFIFELLAVSKQQFYCGKLLRIELFWPELKKNHVLSFIAKWILTPQVSIGLGISLPIETFMLFLRVKVF